MSRCKKCGHQCAQPSWDSTTDMLRFSCICGYSWSKPSLDSKGTDVLDQMRKDRHVSELGKLRWQVFVDRAIRELPKSEIEVWL